MRTRNETARLRRRQDVLRIFEDRDWGNVELLEGWDGEDLEELRSLLDDEEFQALLDELSDQDDR